MRGFPSSILGRMMWSLTELYLEPEAGGLKDEASEKKGFLPALREYADFRQHHAYNGWNIRHRV